MASNRRNLLAELAEIKSAAPAPIDPDALEDYNLTGTSLKRYEDVDDDDGAAQAPSRLRRGVSLGFDARYAGKRVSRRDLQSESSSEGEDESTGGLDSATMEGDDIDDRWEEADGSPDGGSDSDAASLDGKDHGGSARDDDDDDDEEMASRPLTMAELRMRVTQSKASKASKTTKASA
mmetsp:Transcript_855/g.2562  ORF Transcript_855/g.2562 Transcript_855/m.2562 type:complete len:178 (-) Transcript_855:273-806(-)